MSSTTNSSGSISFGSWIDIVNYEYNEWKNNDGILNVTLSGDVTQSTLDSDINNYTRSYFFQTVHLRADVWELVNDTGYGYDVDSNTSFTFIPVTGRFNVTLTNGTNVDVPIFPAGDGTLIVSAGTTGVATISGQILNADGGSLAINVQSGTLDIERGFYEYGSVTVGSGGALKFEGAEPDSTSISLTKSDGTTSTYSTSASDVAYANGSGTTLYAMRMYNSTISADGGTFSTSSTGVIYLDYNNTLSITSNSDFAGNTVVGWYNNQVNVSSNFTVSSGGSLSITGVVDFSSYGFSGDGVVAVYGNYYSTTDHTFHLSTASFEDGSSIGNLAVGYDPEYANGVGGVNSTGEDKSFLNADPDYGAAVTIAGTVSMTGDVTIGGAEIASSSVTLAANAVVNQASSSGGFIVDSAFASFTVGDNVTFGSVTVNAGSATLGTSDTLAALTVNGGTASVGNSNTITSLSIANGAVALGDNETLGSISLSGGSLTEASMSIAKASNIANYTQSGGTATFGYLDLTSAATVSAGTFSAASVSGDNATLDISGTGAVSIASGAISWVTVDSSADSTISATVTGTLTLEDGNSGKTTYTPASLTSASISAGALSLGATATSIGVLDLLGGTITASNPVSIDTYVQAGGVGTFTDVTVNLSATIVGGTFTADDLSAANAEVVVKTTGSVQLTNSTIGTITFSSSTDSSLGGTINNIDLTSANTGTVTVTSGTVGNIVDDGGTLVIDSGVIVDGTISVNGGIIDVIDSVSSDLLGANSTHSTFATNLSVNGGTFQISGTTVVSSVLTIGTNGGTLNIGAGAQFNVEAGSTLAGTLTLAGSGTVYISSDLANASGATGTIVVTSGSTLEIADGVSVSPNIIVQSGGVVELYGASTGTVNITFADGASSGTVRYLDDFTASTDYTISTAFTNFSSTSKIDFANVDFASMTVTKAYYSDGKIYIDYTVSSASKLGASETVHHLILSNVTSSDLKDGEAVRVVSDGSGGMVVEEACFLAGTMVATPQGSKKVETLQSGDEVYVYRNGVKAIEALTWVGEGHCVVRSHLPDDQAGYPVRVAKGALGINVPEQDLLVTPEHCLYLGGGFIPARMLVNNRSITYDRGFTAFPYYHVETASHAIIVANGALTETYLDTGNRRDFFKAAAVVTLKNVAKTWSEDACAPLMVSREEVEPLYRTLQERAIEAGFDSVKASAHYELSFDPDFHLVTRDGQKIHPTRIEGQVWSFFVPSSFSEVTLVSRSARPCDVVGPFLDDRRHLGVLVGEISLLAAGEVLPVRAHLQEELSGWDSEIAGERRWTNGAGVLPLTAHEGKLDAIRELRISVLAAGPYVINEEVRELRKIS